LGDGDGQAEPERLEDHTYWMASWREGGKTRNVHLGSSRKMDAAEARQKAREMKAEALGMRA
jgi:hypothetical protein